MGKTAAALTDSAQLQNIARLLNGIHYQFDKA